MECFLGTNEAANVGILAAEWYCPRTFVAQTSLEAQDGCAGKYVTGLGQDAMAFADDREDVGSLLLTACARLLESYDIDPSSVGRLEVGTETLIDKSKSIKTSLLRLFPGNADLEGVTNVNACYGGTAAVLNSCAWVESSAWDGRYAIVVCGDIAVYEPGPARPSGGCGAVALLIGPDAPLALQPTRCTHALDVWDFYKPKHSEYAAVDGRLSQACYLRSVDACYAGLVKKGGAAFDYAVLHAPYNKLVQKGFARLALGDAVLAGGRDSLKAADWCVAGNEAYEASLTDKALDAALRREGKDAYAAKVAPSTLIPKQIGNTYTASVFAGLASLVSAAGPGLAGKRVLLFSYGSGSVATMYAFEGRATTGKFSLAAVQRALDVKARLQQRVERSAEQFAAACALREERYGAAGYAPSGAGAAVRLGNCARAASHKGVAVPILKGAFRLASVDGKHRRAYEQV